MNTSTHHTNTFTPTDSATVRPRLPLQWWGLGIRFLVAATLLYGLNILSPWLITPLYLLFGHNETALVFVEFSRYLVILALTVGAVALWMRWIERKQLRDAGWILNAGAFKWLGFGVGLAAGLLVCLYAVRLATGLPIFTTQEEVPMTSDGPPVWGLVLILFGMAFFLQGIPEELLFRGWLFNIVRKRPWLAFWWTNLTFTSIHIISIGGQEQWYHHLTYLAIPFGFGALAGALVLLTGSMWTGAGIHSGYHVGQYSIAMLTGEVVSPSAWASLAVGSVFCLAAMVALMVWRRRNKPAQASPCSN